MPSKDRALPTTFNLGLVAVPHQLSIAVELTGDHTGLGAGRGLEEEACWVGGGWGRGEWEGSQALEFDGILVLDKIPTKE